MKTRLIIWLVLPLLFLGCEDDTTTSTPPPPPLSAEDQQVVENCRALRDAIEAYAAAHGGSYGEFFLHGVVYSLNPYSGEHEPSGDLGGSPGQIAVEAFMDCDSNYEVLGYRITGYGRDGVVVTLENIANVPQDVLDQHALTRENVRLVFDAAKQYAAGNDGQFPGDVGGSPNKEGHTLVDLLPNGELLLNPFNSVQENPNDGLGLAIPGAIGYLPNDMVGDGTYNGFVIEAYGCAGDITVTALPYSEREGYVCHNALSLRVAVYQFHQASGHYPHNLDTETTPGGKTVLDLCADNGEEFENPYTSQVYVPSVGIAANKGEVAYQPIEDAGEVTGYFVTGRGVFEEIIRLVPLEN